MSGELELRSATLGDVPALIAREREALEAIVDPRNAVVAEKRAAAIVELARRARLAVEVRNEAVLLRAEAAVLVARTVDAGQAEGWIATDGRPKTVRSPDGFSTLADLGVKRQRLAEARRLAAMDAPARLRDALEREPERELPTMSELLRATERRAREDAVRAKRERLETEAREKLRTWREWATPAYFAERTRAERRESALRMAALCRERAEYCRRVADSCDLEAKRHELEAQTYEEAPPA